MTREEAMKYFGKEKIEPTLQALFTRGEVTRNVHCKVGATYLWPVQGPDQFCKTGDWVYQRTHKEGLTRITCVARRSGVAFLKIEGDPSPSHEEAVFEGSWIVNDLMPEVVDLKVFKQNPELDFVWKTFDGAIKIMNGHEEK